MVVAGSVACSAWSTSLANQGRLTAEQERFRRRMNAWYAAAFPDPCRTHPDTYDRRINPGAAAWFRDTATHLIDRVQGYLYILHAHGLAYQRVQSADPGRIIYQDLHQVVAVPNAQEQRRPLSSG